MEKYDILWTLSKHTALVSEDRSIMDWEVTFNLRYMPRCVCNDRGLSMVWNQKIQ